MTHSGALSEAADNYTGYTVLIPLLLDDPLWVNFKIIQKSNDVSLNPSFAGWPTLGFKSFKLTFMKRSVLIPLLLDDPLWEK